MTDQAPIAAQAELPPETPLTGCDAVRSEVAKYPDWDVRVMTAISQAESGCRYDAAGDGHLTYSANGRTYGYSVGAFQVRILQGREGCDVHDLAINVRCAYNIWKGQSYGAWSVFNSGKYKEFLK